MATKVGEKRWKSSVYIGRDEEGKRKYKVFYAETEDEADYLALAYKTGRIKDETTITVGNALKDYIDSREAVISPSTMRSYRAIERNNFQMIKNVRIKDLTKKMVQNEVRRISQGGASPKTVKNVYMLLASAVHSVEPNKDISVTLPQSTRVTYSTPDKATLGLILEAVKGTKVELPVLMSCWLSLRLSEIMGLQWTDITKDSITIRHTYVYSTEGWVLKNKTKTRGSARVIPMPEYIYKKLMERERTNERVFHPDNNYMISDYYRELLKREGIPHSRFHDLRHAFASHAASLNIPNKVIKGIGGWESDYVMQRVYQQTFNEEERIAMQTLSEYYEGLMMHTK